MLTLTFLLVDTSPGATPRVAAKSGARAACCSAAADAGAMDGGVMFVFSGQGTLESDIDLLI